MTKRKNSKHEKRVTHTPCLVTLTTVTHKAEALCSASLSKQNPCYTTEKSRSSSMQRVKNVSNKFTIPSTGNLAEEIMRMISVSTCRCRKTSNAISALENAKPWRQNSENEFSWQKYQTCIVPPVKSLQSSIEKINRPASTQVHMDKHGRPAPVEVMEFHTPFRDGHHIYIHTENSSGINQAS